MLKVQREFASRRRLSITCFSSSSADESIVIELPKEQFSFESRGSSRSMPHEQEVVEHCSPTAEMLNSVESTTFSVFDLPDETFPYIFYHMCVELGLATGPNVSVVTVARLIAQARSLYRDTTFHSFYHAMDVVQSAYSLLKNGGLKLFRPEEALGLLVGSLLHDMDHDGLTGAYHSRTCSPRSSLPELRFPVEPWVFQLPQGAQERHHCRLARGFIQRVPGHEQLWSHLSEDEYARFERTVLITILATDLGQHAAILEDVRARLYPRQPAQMEDREREEWLACTDEAAKDRLLLACSMIKCADLSSVARTYRLNRRWALQLQQELLEQMRLERELGIEDSPPVKHLTAEDEERALANGQVAFIRNLALPMFRVIEGVLPAVVPFASNVAANLSRWESRSTHHWNAVAPIQPQALTACVQ